MQNFLIWTSPKYYLKYQHIQGQNLLIWTKLHSTVRNHKIELSQKQTLSQISTHCKHSLVAEFLNLDKPETHYLKYQHIQAQNFLIWTELHSTVRNHKIELSPKQTLSQISTHCKHSLVAEFTNLKQTSVFCKKSANRAKAETRYLKYQHSVSTVWFRVF